MFFGIPLRSFLIGIFFIVVPTGGRASDDESVGLYQEHDSPQQEENVEPE